MILTPADIPEVGEGCEEVLRNKRELQVIYSKLIH